MTENDKEGFRRMFENFSGWKGILSGHWDIYIGFMLLADRLVTRSGLHSFIIPNPFAREKYAKEVRLYFLENSEVVSITHFGEKNVFEDVSRQTMIPIFGKESRLPKTEIFKFENGKFKKKRELNAKNFLKLSGNQFRYELSEQEFQILEDMNGNPKLGNFLYVNYGAQVSSKEKGNFGKNELVYDEKGKNRKKFFEGRDLKRYLIDWDDKYLEYRDKEMYGPRAPEFFESPKLVVRHISGEGSTLKVTYDDEKYYCDHGLILATKYDNIVGTRLSEKFKNFEILDKDINLKSVTGCIASRLLSYTYKNQFSTGSLQGSYSHVYPKHVRNFPLPKNIDKLNNSRLDTLVDKICSKKQKKCKINLNIRDYLGSYSEGKTLGEIYLPVSGVSDTVLTDTKSDKDNLKLDRVEFEEKDKELILKASAKYKPENEDEFDDLDRWGYTETELIPAMKFSGSKEQLLLIREFTKLAIEKAGGFASFRKKTTKTTSLINRLEKLTLPKLEDVKLGLMKYLEQREKAEKLEKEIQETDDLIDAIVFNLYDLNDNEVEVVLDSLDTEEKIKGDILEKFEELKK